MSIPRYVVAAIGGAAAAAALVASVRGAAAGGDADDVKTTVTIWRAPPGAPVGQYNPYGGYYGGYGYGGATTGDAGFVTHRRKVDIAASGELRFPGVSTRIDPSTVRFESVTDAKGTTVVEQRYAYDLGSPEKLLRRYVGKQVTVTTTRGEIAGILRGVDNDALVIETGQGAARAVEIVRRGAHLLDVKLAAGEDGLATVPTLVWKVQTGKPGKHDVVVSYRSGGLAWDADYTAILDDDDRKLDLSAWATITNDTGVAYRDAELVLMTGQLETPPPQPMYGYAVPMRADRPEPQAFTVPNPVDVAAGGTVQVELMPARRGVSTRKVVLYETTQDQSHNYQGYPMQDCYGYVAASQGGAGKAALEIDSPTKGVLPDGKVRVFHRKGDSLEPLGEDTLKVNAASGHLRLVVGKDDSVVGTRQQLECKFDERARTLREKFEVKIENKSKQPVEVVLREYMYRWSNFRMDGEDVPGTQAAPQAREYRVKLGPSSKKSFQYTVVYSW